MLLITMYGTVQRGNGMQGEGINICDGGINLSPIKICARNKILHTRRIILRENAESNRYHGSALTAMMKG